jgi:hypothetical protein
MTQMPVLRAQLRLKSWVLHMLLRTRKCNVLTNKPLNRGLVPKNFAFTCKGQRGRVLISSEAAGISKLHVINGCVAFEQAAHTKDTKANV